MRESVNFYDRLEVIEACKRTARIIRAQREAKKEKLIAEKMKERKHWWGKETLTREEAIVRLEDNQDMSTTPWIYAHNMRESTIILASSIAYAAINCHHEEFQLTRSECNALYWEDLEED